MELNGRFALVTGADGFIGSHLVERLVVAEGARVRAFTLYNSFNSVGWIEALPPAVRASVEIFPGDIRDAAAVKAAMAGVDVVFHLAALISIPFSYVAPANYVETNISGTLHVLQAARELATPRLLVTSTSEVYGTARRVPIDEEHPLQGQSPYSATKIGAEKLAEAFHRSFGTPVTVVRPFNTYGPRQSGRAIIPTVISQLLAGRDTLHLGNLAATRDFVFVKDTVRGFCELARADAATGETVNIATGREIAIGELVAHLIARIRPGATVETDRERLRPEKSEVNRLLGDPAKLRRLTGWSPGTTLEAGLDETVDWFRGPQAEGRYRADRYDI